MFPPVVIAHGVLILSSQPKVVTCCVVTRQVVRCKLGDHMDAIRKNLVAVLQPLVSRMADKRVLFTRDPMALKAWGVLEVRWRGRVERTRRRIGRWILVYHIEVYYFCCLCVKRSHGDVTSTGFFHYVLVPLFGT